MSHKTKIVTLLLAVIALSSPAAGTPKKGNRAREARDEITGEVCGALWRNPTDIASRDLFYGPGGKKHQPHGPFTFVKEDLDGSNPKFIVRDREGVKWKIKLGAEARPETVASRLVWAVGYFTNEEYFLQDLRVDNVPARLHRGRSLVAPDGGMHNARLKRYLPGEKKIGNWHWRRDLFTGTRELNGLRVMMALINNWDLKDENNAVYDETHEGRRIYMVSDLGASFGTTGRRWKHDRGNLNSYSHSKFIRKVTPDYVNFSMPTRPSLPFSVNLPEFIRRLELRWIGKNIPRADARWMGELLAQLSPAQIRDAFRAAGYSPREAEGFARVVEGRIAELSDL